jgi:hypothetical protein
MEVSCSTSYFFSISIDPVKKQMPLQKNMTFEALKTLLEISYLKKALLL